MVGALAIVETVFQLRVVTNLPSAIDATELVALRCDLHAWAQVGFAQVRQESIM